MRKLITALAAIIAATNNYWQQNKKSDYPGLPEDDAYADSFDAAQAVLVEAEQNFNAHIDKVGEIYEGTKQKIMQLQANALAQRRMPEAGEDLQTIFIALQELRDLACAEYDPETYALLHEAKLSAGDVVEQPSLHGDKKLANAAEKHATDMLTEGLTATGIAVRDMAVGIYPHLLKSFITGARWMENQYNNPYPIRRPTAGETIIHEKGDSLFVKFSTLGDLKDVLNKQDEKTLSQVPRLWGDGVGGVLYAYEVLSEDHINPSGEGAEPISVYNGEDISNEPVVLSAGTLMLWGDFNMGPA